MHFFSDEECGHKPRSKDIVGESEWRAIRAFIYRRIDDGSFGKTYPKKCGEGTIGTNRTLFFEELGGFVSSVARGDWLVDETPDTLSILDLINFCWTRVATPIREREYKYFDRYYWQLKFDQDDGRRIFCDEINSLFSRNQLRYEITAEGRVIRLGAEILHSKIAATNFDTGDPTLDELLSEACSKFLSPTEGDRKIALDKLFDAWERLKYFKDSNIKKGIDILLDEVATKTEFRKMLEREANEITEIANTYGIRHYGPKQEKLESLHQIDYLFERLFSLIHMMYVMKGLSNYTG